LVANSTSSVVEFEDPPTDSAHQTSFTFGVEEPGLRFVGRKTALVELIEMLVNDRRDDIIEDFVLKILSCGKYGRKYTWLFGISLTTLISSVRSMLKRLKQPSRDSEVKSLSESVEGTIERSDKRRWIFMIDNVDENRSAAETVVTVLVKLVNFKTSIKLGFRHRFSSSGVNVEVETFPDEDAQTYVNDSLPVQKITKRLLYLCLELLNHSLALRQAVDYKRCYQFPSVSENYRISNTGDANELALSESSSNSIRSSGIVVLHFYMNWTLYSRFDKVTIGGHC
jgi:hypothetical protein